MSTEIMVKPEDIRKLREKTGAGMMNCKGALKEAGGDLEKAVEFLRKMGLASAAKKSSRVTEEGLVAAFVTPDGRNGGIIELNCETDFVAKTDEFPALANDLARQVAEGKLTDPGRADAQVKDVIAKLGENMGLKRLDRFELKGPGHLAFYVHTAGGKKGAMVEINCGSDETAGHDAVAELGKELGMQIVAMSPRWLNRDEVPPEDLKKEREIYETEVRKAGKPEAALPKIVEGKINKLFFSAFCLLDQFSMRDPKTKMKDVVAAAAKTAGGTVEVKRFVRYQLGGE